MTKCREETDSMGTVPVPVEAYYGSQTQRAIDNFPVSGLGLPPALIQALALIKREAAKTNRNLGLLDSKIADAIIQAAQEVLDGKMGDQFPIDVFQTGSGTSTNMNLNEVLSARANEILTGTRGGRHPVHPNDHVNRGQSSNDAIPSAIHIAALNGIDGDLIPAMERLQNTLKAKALQFSDVAKIGRTHLQDAVPITLGQEFGGYARQISLGMERIQAVWPHLAELALGGTAVGNGINTHPEFASRTIAGISKHTGIAFTEAADHFEAQGARDAAVETSGALRTIAAGLVKIGNDLRWLASGPRCGIGEIQLPSLQPGSSIMPGKVNPVIAESVIQVAFQVMGNDTTILLCAQSGNFELNVTLPLIAYNLLQSIQLLAAASRLFADRCVSGIAANRQTCEGFIEKSLALVTGLVPAIGYDRAAAIAKTAYETGQTVRQVALAENVLDKSQIDRLLSPK